MLLKRMTRRAPSARPMGVFYLPNHDIAFNKISWDFSGKANVVPQSGSRVYGVLYELDHKHLRDLDDAEGLGYGYIRTLVSVLSPSGKKNLAWLYVCNNPKKMSNSITPYDWYVQHVVKGAESFGLPASYIAKLKQLDVKPDLPKYFNIEARDWN